MQMLYERQFSEGISQIHGKSWIVVSHTQIKSMWLLCVRETVNVKNTYSVQ